MLSRFWLAAHSIAAADTANSMLLKAHENDSFANAVVLRDPIHRQLLIQIKKLCLWRIESALPLGVPDAPSAKPVVHSFRCYSVPYADLLSAHLLDERIQLPPSKGLPLCFHCLKFRANATSDYCPLFERTYQSDKSSRIPPAVPTPTVVVVPEITAICCS